MRRRLEFEGGAVISVTGFVLALLAAYWAIPSLGFAGGTVLISLVFAAVVIVVVILVRRRRPNPVPQVSLTPPPTRLPENPTYPVVQQVIPQVGGNSIPRFEQTILLPPSGVTPYSITTTVGGTVIQTTITPVTSQTEAIPAVGTLTTPAPNSQSDRRTKKEKAHGDRE
jgi:hypothetical protein